jgi:hypothetical protein
MQATPTITINNETGGSGSWVGDLIPVLKPLIRLLTVFLLITVVFYAFIAISIIPTITQFITQFSDLLETGGITAVLSWLFGLNKADEPSSNPVYRTTYNAGTFIRNPVVWLVQQLLYRNR